MLLGFLLRDGIGASPAAADRARHGRTALTAPVAGLTGKGRITADDVISLRAEVFRDGIVTRAEAESLFALHASCRDQSAAWPAFFVEAVNRYIVHQEMPRG